MACGSWKVISDVVDEPWRAFLDEEVERYGSVLVGIAGLSMREGHRHD